MLPIADDLEKAADPNHGNNLVVARCLLPTNEQILFSHVVGDRRIYVPQNIGAFLPFKVEKQLAYSAEAAEKIKVLEQEILELKQARNLLRREREYLRLTEPA